MANLTRDTGSDNVLWADDFVYFGGSAPPIPAEFRAFNGDDLYPPGRSHRSKFADDFILALDAWFENLGERGYRGRPAAWMNS